MNLKTSIYTDEMKWEDIKHSTIEDVQLLIKHLEQSTASTRKRKFENTKKKDIAFTGGFIEEEDDSDVGPGTPRKKRKSSAASTPRKPKSTSKLLTPRHKRHVATTKS